VERAVNHARTGSTSLGGPARSVPSPRNPPPQVVERVLPPNFAPASPNAGGRSAGASAGTAILAGNPVRSVARQSAVNCACENVPACPRASGRPAENVRARAVACPHRSLPPPGKPPQIVAILTPHQECSLREVHFDPSRIHCLPPHRKCTPPGFPQTSGWWRPRTIRMAIILQVTSFSKLNLPSRSPTTKCSPGSPEYSSRSACS
jgi:hypothetical protein